MSDKKQQNTNSEFTQLIVSFINRVESLKFSFTTILDTIQKNEAETDENFSDFIKPFVSTEQKDETKLQVSINLPHYELLNFHKLRKQSLYHRLSSPIIKRNFIIALVSEFDIFLASLIKIIFYTKPEILNSLDKQISFKQLLEFESIENAKEYILEKEIESVLRESHTEHFKWLEQKLGFKTLRTFDTNVWQDFIELTERRNLFVHCDGMVSSQYIKVCQDNKVNVDIGLIGKQLNTNKEYFKKAYNCIYEISIKLAHTIWRKLKPEERENADLSLNDLCLELISYEEYELANILLDFALSEPIINKSNLQCKFLFTLNKAQTLKWCGKPDESKKLLEKLDWSVCRDDMTLAKYVLLDDFDTASKIMKDIGNKILIIHYREWPIFKEFRKTQQFLEAYQEIFNEPFDIATEISPPIIQKEDKAE